MPTVSACRPHTWTVLPFDQLCEFYFDLCSQSTAHCDAVYSAFELMGYDELFDEEDEAVPDDAGSYPDDLPHELNPAPLSRPTRSSRVTEPVYDEQGDVNDDNDDSFDPSPEYDADVLTLDASAVCEPLEYQSQSLEDADAFDDSTTLEAQQLLQQIATPTQARYGVQQAAHEAAQPQAGSNITPQPMRWKVPAQQVTHAAFDPMSAPEEEDHLDATSPPDSPAHTTAASFRPPKTGRGRPPQHPSSVPSRDTKPAPLEAAIPNRLARAPLGQTSAVAHNAIHTRSSIPSAIDRRRLQFDDEANLSSSNEDLQHDEREDADFSDASDRPSDAMLRGLPAARASNDLPSAEAHTHTAASATFDFSRAPLPAITPFSGGKSVLLGKSKLPSLAPLSTPTVAPSAQAASLLGGATNFDLRPVTRRQNDTIGDTEGTTPLQPHRHRREAVEQDGEAQILTFLSPTHADPASPEAPEGDAPLAYSHPTPVSPSLSPSSSSSNEPDDSPPPIHLTLTQASTTASTSASASGSVPPKRELVERHSEDEIEESAELEAEEAYTHRQDDAPGLRGSGAVLPAATKTPPSPTRSLSPHPTCDLCDELPATLYCPSCRLSLCTEAGCDDHVHSKDELRSHERRPLASNDEKELMTEETAEETDRCDDARTRITVTPPVHSPHAQSSLSHLSAPSVGASAAHLVSDLSPPAMPISSPSSTSSSSASHSSSTSPSAASSCPSSSRSRAYHIRPTRFGVKYEPASLALAYDLCDETGACIDRRVHTMPVELDDGDEDDACERWPTSTSGDAESHESSRVDAIVRALYQKHPHYLARAHDQPHARISEKQVAALVRRLIEQRRQMA